MSEVTITRVAVFEHQRKRSVQLAAYTRYYNQDWPGCCLHDVPATGEKAKQMAMSQHRQVCMARTPCEPPACINCGVKFQGPQVRCYYGSHPQVGPFCEPCDGIIKAHTRFQPEA